MPKHLILRFDAPLMSFGAPMVDNLGKTERFISLSALTGLLANALGYDHRDAAKVERLQTRLRFAQRADRPGSSIRDFQTVSLSHDFMMSDRAWTTWGSLDERKGGQAREGTHIRFRDFVADAVYTLSFCLKPDSESPTLEDISGALKMPARPLFIGRKPCLPSTPILYGEVQADSPLEALVSVARVDTRGAGGPETDKLAAWWSATDEETHPGPCHEIRVIDRRDWRNQVHVGERMIRHGLISPVERHGGDSEVPGG